MDKNYVFTQTPEEIQGILNSVPTIGQQVDGLQQNVGTLNDAVGNLGESVTQLQETKVEKVEDKQLSTEDFTSEDKAKLDALPTNEELQLEYASQTEVDGIDERLEVVEQLAQISVSGGEIGIATSSDFDNPTPEQEAKVPTVGAILGCMDEEPTAWSNKPVKSSGVYSGLQAIQKQIDGNLGYTYASGFIASTNGVKQNSEANYATGYIDVEGFDKIIYTRILHTSTTTVMGMAFYDENKTYISGQRCITGAEEVGYKETELAVPSNAKYARFTILGSLPMEAFYVKVEGSIKDRIEELEEETSVIEENVIDINKRMSEYEALSYSYTSGSVDYRTGKKSSSNVNYITGFIDVGSSPFIKYARVVSTSTTTNIGMAFYDESKTYISGQRCKTGEAENSYEETELAVPNNAKYARFTFVQSLPVEDFFVYGMTDRFKILEQKILGSEYYGLGNSLTPFKFPTDRNGYEMPRMKEVEATVKKAYQMSSIEWTPLAPVPMPGNAEGDFPANETVQGLPYSSVGAIDKYIGVDVTFHTFMTAVNNPFSLLYTECVNKNRRRSAWGNVYVATGNCGSYYGTTCSSLVAYATGENLQWATGLNKWCARYRKNYVKVFDQSAQGLRLGDIYWMNGHNMLIVGLKRNTINGEVISVRVIESTMPRVMRRSDFTVDVWERTHMKARNAIMYRSNELYKSFYTPSPFVAIGDEEIEPFQYNDDICTFAGDKASFRESDLIVLNYNLKSVGSWTAIKVFKDNVLVATYQLSEIDQSELPEGQRNHALKLGNSHTYGQYKACMTDGTNDSDFTYWEVIKSDVSATKDGDVFHIEWQTSGVPTSFTVCEINGKVVVRDELSDEDIEFGFKDINLRALCLQQHPFEEVPSSGTYLKVHFKGDYGKIASELIEINL